MFIRRAVTYLREPLRVRTISLTTSIAALSFSACYFSSTNVFCQNSPRTSNTKEKSITSFNSSPPADTSPVPSQPVALVVGCGTGTGCAVARKFAYEGYTVVACRRNEEKIKEFAMELQKKGRNVVPKSVNVQKEDDVVALIKEIEQEIGPIEVAIYNASGFGYSPLTKTTSQDFCDIWKVSCFGGFLMGREVAKYMTERKRGTIIFTGATSSVRGKSGFSAFGSAKNGLRTLSMSMADELGSKGVHVAHCIVDGVIDTPRVRKNFSKYISSRPSDSLIDPSAIADTYWFLHKQPKSTWTFELDLRNYHDRPWFCGSS